MMPITSLPRQSSGTGRCAASLRAVVVYTLRAADIFRDRRAPPFNVMRFGDNVIKKLSIFISLISLVGCTAVGVVESDDPAVKIKQATSLYRKEGRIVVADRLFHQAMHSYRVAGVRPLPYTYASI